MPVAVTEPLGNVDLHNIPSVCTISSAYQDAAVHDEGWTLEQPSNMLIKHDDLTTRAVWRSSISRRELNLVVAVLYLLITTL